jgi:serine/threonine protein kinase
MVESPADRFAPGARIAGYMLEERIGRGGMAEVFRAHDERLNRTVALKILSPGLADDEAFRQRFIRESRAAAAVDDPHIVPVFEAGEASGVLFIAMRYVSGGDVAAAARRFGPLELAEIAGIVSQVASALDAAHGRGLVHRDVKPTNMLLDAGQNSGRPDHVYLSDFGLSKPQVTAAKITATGQFLGTLDYVSPEQVNGQLVGAASDQYSLACAAFELLSGTAPFERDTGLAVLYAHLHEPPPSLINRRPDLPPAVDAVFATALAKAPADRFANCHEFAEAMRAALGLHPYRSQPEGGRLRDGLKVRAERDFGGGQRSTTDGQRIPTQQVGTAGEYPAAAATATGPPADTRAKAVPNDPHAQAVPTEHVSTESGLSLSGGRAGGGSGRLWWRSGPAIAIAAIVALLLGGGTAVLLNGGSTNEPSGTVIFKAGFTNAAGGWQVQQNSANGHRGNGTYYVSAVSSGSSEVAVPTNASIVYPSAPPNIRIDVSGHRTKGPAQDIQYGLACRYRNGNFYDFEVQGTRVTIGKSDGANFTALASASTDVVRADAVNQLTAICQAVAGRQAVRLSLAVNGEQLLSVTDRASPLANGTVGIFVGFYGVTLPTGVEAAFQDFVVRQL